MKKIDIKNKFSDEKALKHKDFNKVLSKYNRLKTPFYRSPKFLSMVAVSTFVIMLIFMIDEKEAYSNGSYTAIYHSPIGIPIEHELIELTIEKDKPTQVITNGGTVINIPENTLVDSSGNLITGKIDLKYRDFLDQKEVFLSGIPMNYDSNGVKMNFKSGGMFEMLAYQNENPLYIANDKKVKVDLASMQVEDDYNIYYFSAEEKKWMYKNRDKDGFTKEEIAKVDAELKNHPKAATKQKLMDEKDKLTDSLMAMYEQTPTAPIKLDINKHSFNINANFNDFPILKAFKKVKFQVSDGDKNFHPKYAERRWNSVEIEKASKKNEYTVCFSDFTQKVCFAVIPVFDGENFEKAQAMHDALYNNFMANVDSVEDYKKQVRKQLAEEAKELEEMKRLALIKEREMRRLEKERQKKLQEMAEVNNKIYREFEINKFGVWNCDKPEMLPSEQKTAPRFVDNQQQEIDVNMAYLVMLDKNNVVKLSTLDLAKGLPYNPGENYTLWTLIPDKNAVGIVSNKQFQNINKQPSTTFNMELIGYEDFKKLSTQELLNI
ncbi:MAG: hypothetical protein K0B10_10100 [Vicingaceae bacterium]|nr:hypothetical protein [Vicingaceae bacterium]